MRNISHTEA
jgi:hypothetical protein